MKDLRMQFDKYITNEILYKDIIPEFRKIYEKCEFGEIVFDMRALEFIEVDAIIPLTRAMIVFAKSVRKKLRENIRILIYPSYNKAFVFLEHAGMLNYLSNWYYMVEGEREYIEYIGRGFNFKRHNRMISFPKYEIFIDSIDRDDAEKLEIIEYDSFQKGVYYRNAIESILSEGIKSNFRVPLDDIEYKYGEQYRFEVVKRLCELATNSVFHGKRESFIYFQSNVRLPFMSKRAGHIVSGQFISAGDIGLGLHYSLTEKSHDDNDSFVWDNSDFTAKCEMILEKYDYYYSDYRTNDLMKDFLDIFEAVYCSMKKQEKTGRLGLFDLIKRVTSENGIVSFWYGKCRVVFDSNDNIEIIFEEAFKELLLLAERKHVSTYKRKIEGLQVDIEIREK